MALSQETAKKIIDVVAADADCRNSIESSGSVNATINPVPDLLFNQYLRFKGLAGSVRNIPLVMHGIVSGKSPEDDPETTAKLCIGIVAVTVKAIIAAIRQGKLPEVKSSSAISRVSWKIHHSATWVRMTDDSEYVFDWHATLLILDPRLSKAENWVKAQGAINFVLFRGFN